MSAEPVSIVKPFYIRLCAAFHLFIRFVGCSNMRCKHFGLSIERWTGEPTTLIPNKLVHIRITIIMTRNEHSKIQFFLVLNEKTNEKRIYWMSLLVKYLFRKKTMEQKSDKNRIITIFVTIQSPFIFFVLFALRKYWKLWNPIRQTVNKYIKHTYFPHGERGKKTQWVNT